MLASSFDNRPGEANAIKTAASADVRWAGRLLLLGLNFIPLLHVAAIALLLWVLYASVAWRIAIGLGCLYLLPPLAARLILFFGDIREGQIGLGTKAFFQWWTLFQLQVIFCRMPALEETLRLVPGLYSQWLRLWGARIGRFTYWSPGTLITDRSFLEIGDDVVFGAGVRLNAHVLANGEAGRLELLLATVKIGNGAMIGGYSLLTAGTTISPGEHTRAFLISPPFSTWKDGKRVRQSPEA